MPSPTIPYPSLVPLAFPNWISFPMHCLLSSPPMFCSSLLSLTFSNCLLLTFTVSCLPQLSPIPVYYLLPSPTESHFYCTASCLPHLCSVPVNCYWPFPIQFPNPFTALCLTQLSSIPLYYLLPLPTESHFNALPLRVFSIRVLLQFIVANLSQLYPRPFSVSCLRKLSPIPYPCLLPLIFPQLNPVSNILTLLFPNCVMLQFTISDLSELSPAHIYCLMSSPTVPYPCLLPLTFPNWIQFPIYYLLSSLTVLCFSLLSLTFPNCLLLTFIVSCLPQLSPIPVYYLLPSPTESHFYCTASCLPHLCSAPVNCYWPFPIQFPNPFTALCLTQLSPIPLYFLLPSPN